MSIFSGKHIILGVTGSIAAYKAVDLASKLTQAGSLVDVVLTSAAEKFISPLSFDSVTGRKAYCEGDLWSGDAHVLHVGLGKSADLLVIAPCTANTLSKIAHGLADNLLTITYLAMRAPILLAPAMDAGMYEHLAVQENIRILAGRGNAFAGPDVGHMASGLVGRGRMTEPVELMGHIRQLLGKDGRLSGKKVVVTAGGTQEPVDPVRVITNRSSGKQGYALAQAAVDAGGRVVLISTPTRLPAPVGVEITQVQTANEMLHAVLEESAGADVLIMAAAVADFRPKTKANHKIKKKIGLTEIELERTPDILCAVNELGKNRPKVVIGFAAETQDLTKNAKEKMVSKNLDMIIANDVSSSDSGFSSDNNEVIIMTPDKKPLQLPLLSKVEVAEKIISLLGETLKKK